MEQFDKQSKIKYMLITIITIACMILMIFGQMTKTLAAASGNGISTNYPGFVYFGPEGSDKGPSPLPDQSKYGGKAFNAQMFKEYGEVLDANGEQKYINWDGIPIYAFADDGFSLWCDERNVYSYETTNAPLSLYYAWIGSQAPTKGIVYEEQTPEGTTIVTANLATWTGAASDFSGGWLTQYDDIRDKKAYQQFIDWLAECQNKGYDTFTVTDGYDGDMQSILDSIATLNQDQLRSYTLTWVKEVDKYRTELAYIFTAKDYGAPNDHYESPWDVPRDFGGADASGFGVGDKFSAYDKQNAIWCYDIYTGGEYWRQYDRGLHTAANKYTDFANNYIQYDEGTDTDKYLDNINVKAVNPEQLNSSGIINDPDAVTLEKNVEYLEDESADTFIDKDEAAAGATGDTKKYNTYTYDSQYIDKLADQGNKRYVLGPYYVDFTYNDQGDFDSFQGADFELKWNAIENIKIYNQDGINIEDLGGKFSIVYDYDPNNTTLPNGGKGELGTRISDEYFVNAKVAEQSRDDFDPKVIDGSETKAFESGKPFFIVIEGLKADNIKDLYIKIDFQYLQSVHATIYQYEGNAWVWKYQEIDPKDEKYGDYFTGTYTWEDSDGDTHTGTETGSGISTKYHYRIYAQISAGQNLIGIYHGGAGLKSKDGDFGRIYKRQCIVIRQHWEEPPEPSIELEKTDSKYDEPLYGARFKIKIGIDGQDVWGNTVKKDTGYFYRKTDQNGKIVIKPVDLNSLGISLKGFTGKVTVEYTETNPPAGYTWMNKNDKTTIVTFQVEKGKLVSGSGCTVKPYDANDATSNKVITKIRNNAITPEITLSKMDKNGKPLSAAFDIHVRYKPDGKREVNYSGNMIYGRTNSKDGGVLAISDEDIARLPENDGLYPLSNYSGTLTLEIVEVHVYETGTSIKSSSFEATLRYRNGKLVDYSEGYTSKVVQTLAYDVHDLLGFVEGWAAKAAKPGATFQGTMPETTWNKVKAWVNEYLNEKYDKSLTDLGIVANKSGSIEQARELTEEGKSILLDALGALTTYLNSDDSRIDGWFTKNTTATLDVYKDSIQLIMENDDGPWVYVETTTPDKPVNPLEMMLAGKVFKDDEQTKAQEHYADGLLGEGDDLLFGIEVELWDITENKRAELIQAEGEIRVNPTITDRQGYYEFRGLDPFHLYKVIFRYDGTQYTATTITPQELTDPSNPNPLYNTADWAVSSKGKETKTGIVNNLVTPSDDIWDPIDLEGLKNEIAEYRMMKILAENRYPEWSEIEREIPKNHPDDKEISAKLKYLGAAMAESTAGYNPTDASGTYPHNSIRNTFLMDIEGARDDDGKAMFAQYEEKYLYPGQLQIHLGLVEKPRTDLELLSDITETEVTINGQSTKYTYGTGDTLYSQYMYQSDYAFAYREGDEDTMGRIFRYRTDYTKLAGKNANAPEDTTMTNIDPVVTTEEITDPEEIDGLAFYGKDELIKQEKELEYYITYKVTIKNVTKQPVKPEAFVTYYDEALELIEAKNAKTGEALPLEVRDNYVFDGRFLPKKLREDPDYITRMNMNYAVLPTGCKDDLSSDTEDYEIILKFRVRGIDGETPAEAFTRLLNTDMAVDKTGRIWDQRFYSEICGYSSSKGYLDADSRVGNFEVDTFETRLAEYRQAVWNYENDPLGSTGDITNDLALTRALQRIIDAREDDAWHVQLEVTDSGFARIIKGNVWEAIDKDAGINTSSNLQADGSKPLTFKDIENLDLSNIKVELIEMIPDSDNGGIQKVRAYTKTNDKGEYVFRGFYPGEYTVRFSYGDGNEDDVIRSKVSLMDSAKKMTDDDRYNGGETYSPTKTDYLPVNGQYYQATLGNPDTSKDTEHYWYKTSKVTDTETGALENITTERYSDAYDDAYSRLTQMNSKIDTSKYADRAPTTDETSSSYTYQGNLQVEGLFHQDRVYAYTSTMKIPVEYIREQVSGNKPQTWYPYNISGVDFGLTPRAYTEFDIYKNITGLTLTLRYTSNPEVYVSTDFEIIKQSESDPNRMEIREIDKSKRQGTAAQEALTVPELTGELVYVDGKITLQIEGLELQNAAMLLKYEITVDNKSEYDTIKYYTDGEGNRIAVAYYGEPTDQLIQFENGTIVYHNRFDCDEYTSKTIIAEDGETSRILPANNRLSGYARFTEGAYTEGNREEIKTGASMIADYLDTNMWYYEEQDDPNTAHTSKWINDLEKWTVVNPDTHNGYSDIITSRHEFAAKYGNQKSLMENQKAIVLATEKNLLRSKLAHGESKTETIYLSANLTSAADAMIGTVSSDVGDTGVSDFYNIAEVVRLDNDAGRVVDVKGYNSSGETSGDINNTPKETVTSRVYTWGDVKTGYFGGHYLTPTIGNSKTYTVQLADPAGLDSRGNYLANLGIVFVGLVILAGGIVGIKKYVVPKAQEK